MYACPYSTNHRPSISRAGQNAVLGRFSIAFSLCGYVPSSLSCLVLLLFPFISTKNSKEGVVFFNYSCSVTFHHLSVTTLFARTSLSYNPLCKDVSQLQPSLQGRLSVTSLLVRTSLSYCPLYKAVSYLQPSLQGRLSVTNLFARTSLSYNPICKAVPQLQPSLQGRLSVTTLFARTSLSYNPLCKAVSQLQPSLQGRV